MNTAIEITKLSKAYRLGQIGTGTISRDLERWWTMKIMRREDPFLKLGQVNDRTTLGDTDIVWSLKDIDLRIEKGDAIGVVGANGAGKTTLLKLLSRITSPTTGKIRIKGRVASLLEVGTGFHHELTGMENIFLNGSILGMRRSEIRRKLDEIIDFSGVERYIDTPIKRYSVGMQVRLAFAIAAHLESEILIVDEVLAVGDLEFQRKCIGKMEEVGQKEGRTVLFVSHNLTSIRRLCRTGILLEKGLNTYDGDIETVLDKYTESLDNVERNDFVKSFVLENVDLDPEEPVRFTIELNEQLPRDSKLLIRFRNQRNINIVRLEVIMPEGEFSELQVEMQPPRLTEGIYHIEVGATDKNNFWLKPFNDVAKLHIVGRDIYGVNRIFNNEMAVVTPKFEYEFIK